MISARAEKSEFYGDMTQPGQALELYEILAKAWKRNRMVKIRCGREQDVSEELMEYECDWNGGCGKGVALAAPNDIGSCWSREVS